MRCFAADPPTAPPTEITREEGTYDRTRVSARARSFSKRALSVSARAVSVSVRVYAQQTRHAQVGAYEQTQA